MSDSESEVEEKGPRAEEMDSSKEPSLSSEREKEMEKSGEGKSKARAKKPI